MRMELDGTGWKLGILYAAYLLIPRGELLYMFAGLYIIYTPSRLIFIHSLYMSFRNNHPINLQFNESHGTSGQHPRPKYTTRPGIHGIPSWISGSEGWQAQAEFDGGHGRALSSPVAEGKRAPTTCFFSDFHLGFKFISFNWPNAFPP